MKKLILIFTLWASICIAYAADYVINRCPVAPVREEPSHAAEQATQLLLGEVCEVVERRSGWIKIRSTVDGQVGWVTSSMLGSISQATVRQLAEHRETHGEAVVATPMAVATSTQTGQQLMLTIGTRLPQYANGTFQLLDQQYLIDSACVYQTKRADGTKVTGQDLVRVARSLMNVPYLWGGKNIMGYDCSGFTQTVYSVFGINLLRNAREQVTQGQTVKSLAEAQPGDLVFFDHADRDPKATRISHVGMLISQTEVIHCAGYVHINKIDDMGIRLSNGKLSHHLAQIKRYID